MKFRSKILKFCLLLLIVGATYLQATGNVETDSISESIEPCIIIDENTPTDSLPSYTLITENQIPYVSEKDFWDMNEWIMWQLYPKVIDENNYTPPSGGTTQEDKTEYDNGDHTNIPNVAQVDVNALVGEIEIISGTNKYGAKSYEVPLIIPDGILKESTPEISLSYNSQRGLGKVGKGWEIGGIDEIKRVTRNAIFNGTVQGIGMNRSDAFILGGQRLQIVGENESLITYSSLSGNIKAVGHLADTEISHFEVYYPDGRKAVYGSDENTHDLIEYPLVKQTDMFGNEITYRYESDWNNTLIKEISYHNCKIIFNYETVSNYIMDFYAGVELTREKRLKTIVINQGNSTLRTYTLDYIDKNGEWLLEKIRCDFPGGEYLNPLQFYYGEASTYGTTSFTSGLNNGYKAEDLSRIVVRRGRIGLDGTEGIIVYPNIPMYWQLKRDVVEGETTIKDGTNTFVNYFNPDEKIFVYTGLSNSTADQRQPLLAGNGFLGIETMSIDGSEQEHIVRINSRISNNKEQLQFNIYKCTTSQDIVPIDSVCFELDDVFTDHKGNKSAVPKKFLVGDFNGDGKDEIAAITAKNAYGTDNASQTFVFDLSNKTKMTESGYISYKAYFFSHKNKDDNEIIDYSDRFYVFDANGDGKDDICHIKNDKTITYTINKTEDERFLINFLGEDNQLQGTNYHIHDFHLGDFNGDGYVDILPIYPKTTTGEFDIYYSMGNGKLVKETTAKPMAADAYTVQDMDNDGLSELIAIKYSPSADAGLYTYRVQPDSCILMNHQPLYDNYGGFLPIKLTQKAHEIGMVSLDLVAGRLRKYIPGGNDITSTFCTGMVNSRGVVEETDYRTIGSSDIHITTEIEETVYPYARLNKGLRVVGRVSRYSNGELIDSVGYRYKGATINYSGLGFCGFQEITTHDFTGRETCRTYNPYMMGVQTSDSIPSKKETFRYEIVSDGIVITSPITSLLDKTISVNLRQQTTTDLTTNKTVNKIYAYDTFGYPTQQIVIYDDNYTETTTSKYTHQPTLGNNYNLGLILEQSIIKKKGENQYKEKYAFSSYNKRKPTNITRFVNDSRHSSETYTYNSKGMLLNQSKSRGTSQSLTEIYTYDSNDRKQTYTDPLGLTTQYCYTNEIDRPSSVILPRNIIINYQYDSLGRIIRADDGESVSTMTWNWQGNTGISSVESTMTGTPNQIIIYDALNREIQRQDVRFDGSLRMHNICYDLRGNKIAESLPYKGNSTPQWIAYEYDSFDRLTSVTHPSGKTTTHSYSGMSITTTDEGIPTTRTFDQRGNLVHVSTAGIATLTYTYGADNLPQSIVSSDGSTTTISYDNLRRRTMLTDPSYGRTEFTYDNSGNLTSQTDAMGRRITYAYDTKHRLVGMTAPELRSTYTYNQYGELTNVATTNHSGKSYAYDSRGRLVMQTDSVEGVWLRQIHGYVGGVQTTKQYQTNSGMTATENYLYSNGTLTEIRLNNDTINPIYKLTDENALGQITRHSSGKMRHINNYTSHGMLTSQTARAEYDPYVINPIETGPLSVGLPTSRTYQSMQYAFNPLNGNLMMRQDGIHTNLLAEQFSYDALNRLTYYRGAEVAYSPLGNIISKSDVGQYSYTNATRPYAVTAIDLNASADMPPQYAATYTSFRRPAQITSTQGAGRYIFTYNGNHDLVKRQTITPENTTSVKYYLGGCYEKENNTTERLYIGGDYYTAEMVMIRESGTTALWHIVRDHLGSITYIVDNSPQPKPVQELSYDAWGRFRNPNTHEVYVFGNEPELKLGRGYCGHEYLPMFGLVNMNARLYDPQNGRLLAPDPMIQTPDNPQNFNRYTYCLNNPLRYTDPTGMFATEEEARNYGNKYGGAEVGYSHLRGEWYVLLNGRGTWKYTGGTTITKAYNPQYYEESFFMGGSPGSTPNYENLPEAANTIAGGLGASNGVTTTVIDKVAKGVSEYAGYLKGAKSVGRACATINIGIAGMDYYIDYKQNGFSVERTGKLMLDGIAIAVGIWGGLPGAIISGTYFLIDVATDGFGMNDN